MNEPNISNFTDHDMLIRLDTRMGGLETEMRLMRDGTNAEIKDLKSNKLDRVEFIEYKVSNEAARKEKVDDISDDFKEVYKEIGAVDKKTDFLLKVIYIGMGILGTIEFAAPVLLHYYFGI